MTAYEMLIDAEKNGAQTIEIMEIATGKSGVANSKDNGVMCFYGNNDGRDDKEFTAEEFSEKFRITAVLKKDDVINVSFKDGVAVDEYGLEYRWIPQHHDFIDARTGEVVKIGAIDEEGRITALKRCYE